MKKINIGFSGNNMRIMELTDTGEVNRLEEVTLSFNLDNDKLLKKHRKEYLEEFSEIINGILDTSGLEPYEANILIDTGLAFMNIIPVDFSDRNSSINAHIHWDLSNYFPETYKDYNVKCFRLNNYPVSEKVDEVLLIAVSNIKTDFLKNVCNNCNIIVKKIEIDQFATEKYIRNKKSVAEASLIIGFRNNRLDLSLIVNGVLKYYDYEITEREIFKLPLLRQLNFFLKRFGNIKIVEINIYGEEKVTDLKNFLIESVKNIPDLNVGNIDILYDTEIHESKYAPLYGLAVSSNTTA
ncbi:MAG TPA: hypothetical protein PK294_04780 [Ignavibacteria bacterium]|nr:hypothetical protein [Ignavibacteria bacterium]HQY51358.1 hypothetical protein [Ignavibacteria bacterium]HRA99737.1 hypothetical protein [Ignavibacteria bacterium]